MPAPARGTSWVSVSTGTGREEPVVAEEKGKGSKTAKKANAKAGKEGESNPRKSSAAQSELGKKGGKSNKKSG